jgi:hypothetical protein
MSAGRICGPGLDPRVDKESVLRGGSWRGRRDMFRAPAGQACASRVQGNGIGAAPVARPHALHAELWIDFRRRTLRDRR